MMKTLEDYDYIIINKNLETCFSNRKYYFVRKKFLTNFLINFRNPIIYFWFDFGWS